MSSVHATNLAALVLAVSMAVACAVQTPTPPPHRALRVLEADSHVMFRAVTWHPSGSYLVATGYAQGFEPSPPAIYGVDPTTGKTWRLQDGQHPAWTPDGQTLSYASCQEDRCGIFTTRVPDNGSLSFLRHGDMVSWSPDGKRVAISDWRSVNQGNSKWIAEVVIVDTDTHAERVVYRSPASAVARVTGLAWSPTGDTLAFSVIWREESADYPQRLYTVRADGSELHALASTLRRVSEPGWMSDGKWLFVLNGGEDGARLSFVHLDQGCIVDTDLVGDLDTPAISPDGTRLALACYNSICLVDLKALLGPGNAALTCDSPGAETRQP